MSSIERLSSLSNQFSDVHQRLEGNMEMWQKQMEKIEEKSKEWKVVSVTIFISIISSLILSSWIIRKYILPPTLALTDHQIIMLENGRLLEEVYPKLPHQDQEHIDIYFGHHWIAK